MQQLLLLELFHGRLDGFVLQRHPCLPVGFCVEESFFYDGRWEANVLKMLKLPIFLSTINSRTCGGRRFTDYANLIGSQKDTIWGMTARR